MNVNCEGCAGCCLDWRPIAETASAHERRGPGDPLDDAYNFVPLTRDEVARFVDRGFGDALTARLWRVDGETPGVVESALPRSTCIPDGRRRRVKPLSCPGPGAAGGGMAARRDGPPGATCRSTHRGS